ncbi:MAG: glycosyltransferase family 39 protein [Endomicrobiales bacterium]|nr:glycosyltransferase family 39 protein [Endomicrobiales bacterium]
MEKTYVKIIFAFLVFSGTLIRFHGISERSLWIDEIGTLKSVSFNDFRSIAEYTKANDTYPPLYFFMVHFVTRVFGDSETALRTPSAIFGILSIFFIFLLGRTLFSEREGLLAALFATSSMFAVEASREARAYSMLLCFATLSFFYAMRIWKAAIPPKRISASDALGFILSSVIAAYTHYYGSLMAAILIIFLFFAVKGHSRAKLVILLVYVGTAMLWFSSAAYQFKNNNSFVNWLQKPSVPHVLGFFLYAFNNSLPLTTAAAATALLSKILQFKKKNAADTLDNKQELILWGWLVIPVAVSLLFSSLFFNIFQYRYLIVCLPAIYLLVARYISLLVPAGNRFFLIVSLLAVLAPYHLVFTKHYYSIPAIHEIKEASCYLMNNKKVAGDGSLLISNAFRFRCLEYYFAKEGFKKKVLHVVPGELEEMNDALKKKNWECVWVFDCEDKWNDILEKISERYSLIERKDFNGTRVFLFERSS